ncbi:MAG: gliding motility protein GldC [Sphingobacteriales bacterium]|jgi:gliding motility-associated protein GldC|nr:MAG: gliding motility protein GldC [Sphingobacteriales bacterium]
MAKESEIKFKIELDQQHLPESITWFATDNPNSGGEACKTMLISMWDGNEKNTLNINLWTKDMQVDEMHTHFFQTMLNLGETYFKATANPYIQNEIKQFCMDLADKTRAWEESGRKNV